MSKITEQFVPYKQAKELQELGFDEECFGFYQNDESLAIVLDEKDIQHFTNKKALKNKTYQCIAPLYSQAFDWFREKYKLMISINVSSAGYYLSFFKDEKFEYYFQVQIGKEPYLRMKEYYITYQEAQLACLDKLIDLVKEKK